MRRFKTAFYLIKNRGINNTFWYSVRKIFDIFSSKRRFRVLHSTENFPNTANVGKMKMHFHPSMRGVSEAVRVYNIHEPVTTNLYLEHLRPGNRVIEIGANIGYYVLLASSQVGETGSVIGIEPVPDNFLILEENVKGLNNVKISQLAISNENGIVDFYVSEIPNWGSLIYTDGLQLTGKVEIQCVKLDDYLISIGDFYPDIIHMDIEGGEIQAIEGAWQTITQSKPSLLIEFHPFITGYEPVKEILAGLIDLGYDDCIQIDRQVDEPWIPPFVRNLRKKENSLSELIKYLDARTCSPIITLLIGSPN